MRDLITVLMPTSPIPAHPATNMIEETLLSIRTHLPACRVIVMCDGVRPEQEQRRGAYTAYLSALRGQGVECREFPVFQHQAAMLRETLEAVETELVLWVEHDMPLWTTPDRPIPWRAFVDVLQSTEAYYIRLMLTECIHAEHEYLMCGRVTLNGHPFVRTTQWSGWPHLANTQVYRRMLRKLGVDARCMVEPFAYGQIVDRPWNEGRLLIYVPDEQRASRCYHLDGRKADPKFEETFTY